MFFKDDADWKTLMEGYNAPYEYEESKQGKRWLTDCYRNVHVCEKCNSVYEFAGSGSGKTGMVVYKYSQLMKRGFEVKTCPHCQDSTIPVEWY